MEDSSSKIQECHDPITFPAPKKHHHLTSRRTPSTLSSSSLSSFSSSSDHDYASPLNNSPAPATSSFRFSGIPFSWEKLPGIPKNNQLIHNNNKKKKELLPLPPPAAGIGNKKQSFRGDPFIAALVNCTSRIDDHDQEPSGRSTRRSTDISERFEFMINLYTCKSSCAVSESSMIYVPRSSSARSTNSNYHLLNRHSR